MNKVYPHYKNEISESAKFSSQYRGDSNFINEKRDNIEINARNNVETKIENAKIKNMSYKQKNRLNDILMVFGIALVFIPIIILILGVSIPERQEFKQIWIPPNIPPPNY